MHNMMIKYAYKNDQDEGGVLYQDVVIGETVSPMWECNVKTLARHPH